MSLTEQQRQEQLDVIRRTGGNREVMLSQRVIPDSYVAYSKLVEREEQTLTLPGAAVPVRLIVSKALDRKPGCSLHVNFHGGGFILPQNGDDDLYCARIAAGIHGIVVDVDYATSDKHPFPAAYDQSYAAVRWAFEQCAKWGGDPRRVSTGGHSAGGNLAAVVSMKAARTGDFKLCMQILDYAATDNYMSLVAEGQERSKAFSLLYADGDVERLKTPAVSPNGVISSAASASTSPVAGSATSSARNRRSRVSGATCKASMPASQISRQARLVMGLPALRMILPSLSVMSA